MLNSLFAFSFTTCWLIRVLFSRFSLLLLLASRVKYLFLGDKLNEVNNTAGVTPLVVVPGDELDKVVVQGDTSLGIEDGGGSVANQILRDNIVLGVVNNALELALSSLLDGGLDLVIGSTLFDAAGQIDDGNVSSRDTHRHAGKLAVERRNDLADSLGSTGGGGDDVLGGTTATSPVLAGRTIDGLLGSSVRVDGGHETLNDGELVVNDLGKRGQAVGGAGSVGENVFAGVGLLVHAHDEHGSIGGGSRDDDLLGTTLKMQTGLLLGGEDTGRLDDVGSTGLFPRDGGRVPLSEESDLLAVNLKTIVKLLDLTLVTAMSGVVSQKVSL